MTSTAALPFSLRRSSDTIVGGEVTSTAETIDGLLRLEGDRMVVQWRVRREISRVGREIRTDEELEPVREATLPLHALAGAAMRQRGWAWFRRTQLTLTAADLRAFEEVAGAAGLQLAHPATLDLDIPRAEQLPAREFAAELNVRIAEIALPEAARDRQRLPGDSQSPHRNREG
jgi:hypothetical protein